MKKIAAFFEEIRIKSWLKNLFVILPLIFSLELLEVNRLFAALILTLAFCLVSSAVYVLNDLMDIENDRNHPIKKNRPLASSQIGVPFAWVLTIVLLLIGLGLAFWMNLPSFIMILVYFVINILYSKWLKKIPVIDCFCIAAGFLLRTLVGGTVVTAGVSDWMFLTVVALSLFMAFGKRRGELHSHEGLGTRDVLESYEIGFLNNVVFMCAGLTVVFYSLWSISQKTRLMYTVPVVLFIVIRYLLLVFRGRGEADPTTLILSDKTLLIACGICGLIIVGLLYGGKILAII